MSAVSAWYWGFAKAASHVRGTRGLVSYRQSGWHRWDCDAGCPLAAHTETWGHVSVLSLLCDVRQVTALPRPFIRSCGVSGTSVHQGPKPQLTLRLLIFDLVFSFFFKSLLFLSFFFRLGRLNPWSFAC
jgi:hypothetical protein